MLCTLHRSGTCTYVDGAVYQGEWREDLREGWGAHTFKGGARYEGEWAADKMHGGAGDAGSLLSHQGGVLYGGRLLRPAPLDLQDSRRPKNQQHHHPSPHP